MAELQPAVQIKAVASIYPSRAVHPDPAPWPQYIKRPAPEASLASYQVGLRECPPPNRGRERERESIGRALAS